MATYHRDTSNRVSIQEVNVDVAIPTVAVESLNAAIAAGVMLYEARRQRALVS